MADSPLYPYVLQPKLAPALWGGHALVRVYGKAGDPDAAIGESWECWDENRVRNGPLAGRSVAELRRELGPDLLGDLDANRIFPILTKIIDAHEALSVQVHPDDAYARRVEGQRNGKTECWYVLAAAPQAQLVLGWAADTSREEYERRVKDGSLAQLLRRVPVRAGDVFYLPAGTLHAIGAGIVVFETQQASDLTYRIFDWNRVGPDGKPRALHVDKAADVLDYRESHAGALEPLAYAFEGFARSALVADPNFVVELVTATETPAEMSTHGRPLVLMALERGLELTCEGGSATLAPYETALVPAAARGVRIRSGDGSASFTSVAPPASPDSLTRRLREAGVAAPAVERFLAQFAPAPAQA